MQMPYDYTCFSSCMLVFVLGKLKQLHRQKRHGKDVLSTFGGSFGSQPG